MFRNGQGHCIVFLCKTRNSCSASLLSVLQMSNSKFNTGVMCFDELASHPGGSSNSPSCFLLQKSEISTILMGHLVHMQTLSFVN